MAVKGLNQPVADDPQYLEPGLRCLLVRKLCCAAIPGEGESYCSEDPTRDTDSEVLDENEVVPLPLLKENLKE